MPQRIHQRLPYRSAHPRDFSSRYDNKLKLSPAAEADPQHVEQRRVRKHKSASDSERRPWRQQALDRSELLARVPAATGPKSQPFERQNKEQQQGQRQQHGQQQGQQQGQQRQWHAVDENEVEETGRGNERQWRQQHTQSSRRSSYRSPTESSKRSVRAQARHTSAWGKSDSSLNSTRSARRSSLQELPDVSAVRDLQKKFRAASFTSKGPKLHDLFKRFDRNHSGGLNFDEFSRAVRVEGRTPEWKMDEGMLRALFGSLASKLGTGPHDEISVSQCVSFVEHEWSQERKPEPEPEPEANHSGAELQLNSAPSSPSRRPGGSFGQPSADTDPSRAAHNSVANSIESSGSEDSYDGRHYGRQSERTARERVSLDADDNHGNIDLSDSTQSDQKSGNHSRRHHRAERSARRQVYSPPDRETLAQYQETASALYDSTDSFTGEDVSDSDRSEKRRRSRAPYDAENADDRLELQHEQEQEQEQEQEHEHEHEHEHEQDSEDEQEQDTEDEHDEEEEGLDCDGLAMSKREDEVDGEQATGHVDAYDEGDEERAVDARPQIHEEGRGAEAWRRKLVLMKREHAEHVAELQRQHLAMLEAVVKEGAAVNRAHTKQILKEEIARAIADPQTRPSMFELQPQHHEHHEHHEKQQQQQQQQQQEHGTVSLRQHEYSGVAEHVATDDFLSPTARHELKQAWDSVDENGDGYLERDELRSVFDQVGPTYTNEQWQQAFAQIDVNGSGRVSFGEFRTWLNEYHVAKKAKILSGKTEILRDALTGGHGDEHAPVLFNGDSLAFANGAHEDSQEQWDQHSVVARSSLLQSAVASNPIFDPFNIPTDTGLAVLMRKVVAGSNSRAFNVTVTAEDEDMQVSFQQASRLCELVFPLSVGAAAVAAELTRVLLVPTPKGALSQAQTEAVSRQQIVAEHSAQYRAKMSRAFDGADWFGTRRLNGIWACRAMLYYFVWFDRAWSSLQPLVTRSDDAPVSQNEFNTMVRELRLPFSNEEISRCYVRLAAVAPSRNDHIRGTETVTADSICRWAVRSCVAKEQGWPEPVEPEPDTRKSKSKSRSRSIKNDKNLQQKPKMYSRQNRVTSPTSEERDEDRKSKNTTGQSSRGTGSVGSGVYKSSRSLGLRPMAARPAVAQASERHQAMPRRVAVVDESGSDVELDGSESTDAYGEEGKQAANELELDMVWPNTQVDDEVPPLPSRVPPFLR